MFDGVKLGETGQLTESGKGGYSVTSHSQLLGQTTMHTFGGKTMKCTNPLPLVCAALQGRVSVMI